MRYRQAIIAFVLGATWIITALHAGLEANEWMLEHVHRPSSEDHSHVHTSDMHAEAHTHGEHGHEEAGNHEPVVARSSSSEGRTSVWLLALFAPLVGVIFWLAFHFRPRVFSTPLPPCWREEHALARWCFVWRCASFTTAPPALG